MYIKDEDSLEGFSDLTIEEKIIDIAKTCFEVGLSIEEALELIPKDETQNILFRESVKLEMEMLIYGYSFN